MTERLGRSLQASVAGIIKANKATLAFARKADLAEELEISRSTLQKFFSGKPIGRENFHQICQRLGLEWREIADLPHNLAIEPDAEPDVAISHSFASSEDIDALVQLVRQQGQASIQAQCGYIRILDMSQPLALKEIYTPVNVFEKISGRRRISSAHLTQGLAYGDSDRPLLESISGKRFPALEAVKQFDKLLILGRPGVGKTVFLKYLALQCSSGEFEAQRVPMFVSLKDFAELPERSSLLEYINQQIGYYGIAVPQPAEQLLQHGRMVLLLDGLDEVGSQNSKQVVQEVQRFSTQFPLNRFVLSCRIASHEYTFAQFTEVEVADFDCEQIDFFVHQWFTREDSAMGDWAVDKSHLAANQPLRELATNPLLLTWLCLIFRDCGKSLPNRSELYREGLHILLKQWDSKRHIEREQIHRKLSLWHKEVLLSHIAWLTFSRGSYFFSQGELAQRISDYLSNLLHGAAQPTMLQLDCEAVVKEFEAQHGLLVERARGIYAFSALAFQEYFVARSIVDSATPQSLEVSLKKLANHCLEPRWRETFLLTSEMLHQPARLLKLMKQQIDHLLDRDLQLQQCLSWLCQKSASISAPHHPGVIRAFYLDLEVARILNQNDRLLDLARALDPDLTRQLDANLSLDLALDRILTLTRQIAQVPEALDALNRVLDRASTRADTLDPVKTIELVAALRQAKAQLPKSPPGQQAFNRWWQEHGQVWTKKLRKMLILHRNIGHDWQFSEQQQQKLKQYYGACCLFIDCLNSATHLAPAERAEIKQALFQPSLSGQRSGCGVA